MAATKKSGLAKATKNQSNPGREKLRLNTDTLRDLSPRRTVKGGRMATQECQQECTKFRTGCDTAS